MFITTLPKKIGSINLRRKNKHTAALFLKQSYFITQYPTNKPVHYFLECFPVTSRFCMKLLNESVFLWLHVWCNHGKIQYDIAMKSDQGGEQDERI